ncbi:MAG: DUF3482 domain-containing protein, partial [Planctomycetota bacterium]
AAGAAKGSVLDIATGGFSLGLGVALGGAAGFALGGRELTRHALRRARGEQEVGFSPEAIAGVLSRGFWLLRRLRFYGHASERPIEPPPPVLPDTDRGSRDHAYGLSPDGLRAVRKRLEILRSKRGWSRLAYGDLATHGPRPENAQREVMKIGSLLAEACRNGPHDG